MAEIYSPKTFEQVYTAMQDWLVGQSSSLNNFNVGSRLSVLLEAISLILSQTQQDFYVGLKNAIPVSVYNAFGFKRLDGNKSSGYLTFTRSTVAVEDYLIPIGTSISYNGLTFETTEEGNILTGQTTSGSVASRCSTVGVTGNIGVTTIDTANGQGSFINKPDGIEACSNTSAFTNGTDLESDIDRLTRFNAYVQSLARSTVQGLISGALSVVGVRSASVLEYYPSLGWVTLFVDDGTGTLSDDLLLQVRKVIEGDITDPENYAGYRPAGIQVQILVPQTVDVPVTASIDILYESLADDDALKTKVATAIEQYVNSLRLGKDVVVTELITAIHNCDVEVFDVRVALPLQNVPIPINSIARTGRTGSPVIVTSTRVGQ